MKNLVAFLLLCTLALSSSAQFGFYKNIFGDYGVEGFDNPPPTLLGMQSLSDGGYIISTHSNPNSSPNYSSYMKLDNNFNSVWTTSYGFLASESGMIEHKAELDDQSLIALGHGVEPYMILRHDNEGNLLSSGKYFSDESTYYAASAICKSTDNDTGYVALFSQCAMDFGVVKIGNDAEVLWAKDYGGNNIWGNIYELTQAIDEGYRSIGQWTDIPYDDSEGILLHLDGNGDVIKSTIFRPTVEGKNFSSIRRILPSPLSDHYFISMLGGVRDAVEPLELDNEHYLLQLDTETNVVHSWVFSSDNPDQSVIIEAMKMNSDGHLIIYGRLRENSTNYRDLFILGFDPSDEGEILWSKSVQSVEMPFDWASSDPIRGLELYGPEDHIIFPLAVQNEGQLIAGMDKNGEGLCRAVDLEMHVAAGEFFEPEDFPLTYQDHDLSYQPIELFPISKEHPDTMICSNIETSVVEQNMLEENYAVWSDGRNLIVSSAVERTASISLYNIAGQLILSRSISPYSMQQFPLPHGGVFLYRLHDGVEVLTGKASGW